MLEGGEYRVDDSLSIGRNPENNLQILSMRASRFHAEIRRQEDGRYWLWDLDSVSGTLLNDKKIDSQPLQDGDEISIGDTTLRFEEGEASAAILDPPVPTDQAPMTLPYPNEPNMTVELQDAPEAARQACHQVLQYMLAILPAERGIILLRRLGTGSLVAVASRESVRYTADSPRWTDEELIDRVVETREAVFRPSRIQEALELRHAFAVDAMHCAMCAPLLTRDGVLLGAIYLDSDGLYKQLMEQQLCWVTAAAGQAAGIIERSLPDQWVPSEQPGEVVIRVLGGAAYGQEHPVGGELTLGRSSQNGVQLQHLTVSRFHARIEQEGTRYRLTDLGSAHRTRLNGEVVMDALLSEGDEIAIGEVCMQLLRLPAPLAPPRHAPVVSISQAQAPPGRAESEERTEPPAPAEAVELSEPPEPVAQRAITLDGPPVRSRPPAPAASPLAEVPDSTIDGTTLLDLEVPDSFLRNRSTPDEIHDGVLSFLSEALLPDRAVILIREPGTEELSRVATRLREPYPLPPGALLNEDVITSVMQRQEAVFKSGWVNDEPIGLNAMEVGDPWSVLCAPMVVGGRARGVVYLDRWDFFRFLTSAMLPLVAAVADRAAAALFGAGAEEAGD